MSVAIRPEVPADHPAVASVNERAFGQPHESKLIAALRGKVDRCISLVAELGSRVVGQVFFTPVRVVRDAGGVGVEAMALGPVAVDPDHQRGGIGSNLVRAGLDACRSRGEPAVFVLGHPQYYPRFGFVPAAPLGIRCEFPVPDELFFALELEAGSLRNVTGTVRYHSAFAELEDSP